MDMFCTTARRPKNPKNSFSKRYFNRRSLDHGVPYGLFIHEDYERKLQTKLLLYILKVNTLFMPTRTRAN